MPPFGIVPSETGTFRVVIVDRQYVYQSNQWPYAAMHSQHSVNDTARGLVLVALLDDW